MHAYRPIMPALARLGLAVGVAVRSLDIVSSYRIPYLIDDERLVLFNFAATLGLPLDALDFPAAHLLADALADALKADPARIAPGVIQAQLEVFGDRCAPLVTLHKTLFAGFPGRSFVSLWGVALLVLIVAGLVAHRRRWPDAARVRRDRGARIDDALAALFWSTWLGSAVLAARVRDRAALVRGLAGAAGAAHLLAGAADRGAAATAGGRARAVAFGGCGRVIPDDACAWCVVGVGAGGCGTAARRRLMVRRGHACDRRARPLIRRPAPR